MIISKTPFRISFFGGGTDYPVWLTKNKGAVLVTTIDKYCYISCRALPPFFEHRSRIIYSLIELVKEINEIQHPSVRECLRFMNIRDGIEIHHDGDLPSRTGLGSSSAFTVGLLKSLYALKGDMISNLQLAKNAILIEQEKIGENVGYQDQIATAYGGFNLIEFNGEKDFKVIPVTLNAERLKDFHCHLLLIYTGLSRTASEIAGKLVETIPQKEKELKAIHQMVYQGIEILKGHEPLAGFGDLLHESWELKRGLTDKITTPEINQIYELARRNGALGGKLLGAGGGGFLLLFAEPNLHPKIISALKGFLHVPFQFENLGSQIIYYQPDEVSKLEEYTG